MVSGSGIKYSKVATISIRHGSKTTVTVFPNPVSDAANLHILATRNSKLQVDVFDASGKRVISSSGYVRKGDNVISIEEFYTQPDGIYFATIYVDETLIRQKILVSRVKIK